jgi:hypothetical protein
MRCDAYHPPKPNSPWAYNPPPPPALLTHGESEMATRSSFRIHSGNVEDCRRQKAVALCRGGC